MKLTKPLIIIAGLLASLTSQLQAQVIPGPVSISGAAPSPQNFGTSNSVAYTLIGSPSDDDCEKLNPSNTIVAWGATFGSFISATNNPATWTNVFTSAGWYTNVITCAVTFKGTDCDGTNYSVSTNACVTNVIGVVALDNVQYQDCSGNWTNISNFEIPKGKSVTFKAIPSPTNATFPSGFPIWGGEASGSGATTTVTFNNISTSDTDLKEITCACGVTNSYPNFLVCNTILHIDSNEEKPAGFTSGHAWILVTDLSAGSTTSYGLYKDNWPSVQSFPVAAPGSGVRVNVLGEGPYVRYFLCTPSQATTLQAYITTPAHWHYRNTCAAWAVGAQPNDVSASDHFGFCTPRALGTSISGLELTDPTSLSDPKYEEPVSCGAIGGGGSSGGGSSSN